MPRIAVSETSRGNVKLHKRLRNAPRHLFAHWMTSIQGYRNGVSGRADTDRRNSRELFRFSIALRAKVADDKFKDHVGIVLGIRVLHLASNLSQRDAELFKADWPTGCNAERIAKIIECAMTLWSQTGDGIGRK